MKNLCRTYLGAFLIASLSLFSVNATCQNWEYGFWVGGANYFGDLNPRTSFEFVGPGVGGIVRLNFSERFAYRLTLSYGKVAFKDEGSVDPFPRARNLSFKSSIAEVANLIEFNFFRYDRSRYDLSFTPYLFTGLSGFFFNPKAELDGETYALQPIGTEGQNNPDHEDGKYLRISWGIPLGGGFKYSFNRHWTIGVEVGVRKTFTDYLDDVSTVYPDEVVNFDVPTSVAEALSDRSGEVGEPIGTPGKQRGDPLRNDDFAFFGITLTYNIFKDICPKPGKIK